MRPFLVAWLTISILYIGESDDSTAVTYIDIVAPNNGPLGLELSPDLKVMNFSPNSKVERIEVGDELVAINKQKLAGQTLEEVVSLIRSSIDRVLTFKRLTSDSIFKKDEIKQEGMLDLRVGRQDSLLKIPIKESLFGGGAWCSSLPLYLASIESRQLCQPIFSEELNDIKGSIFIVERGGCSFTDKALIAVRMGVKALIILNNPGNTQIISMPASVSLYSEAASLSSIPVVMAHFSSKELIEQLIEKKHVGGKVSGSMHFGEGCIEDDGTFRHNSITSKKVTKITNTTENEVIEEEGLKEEEIQSALEESERMEKVNRVIKANKERVEQGIGAGVFHLLSSQEQGQIFELEFLAGGLGGTLPLSPLKLYPLVVKHDRHHERQITDKQSLSSSSMKVGEVVEFNSLINITHSFPLVQVQFRDVRPKDREIYINLLQEKEKEISSQKLEDWVQGSKKQDLGTPDEVSSPNTPMSNDLLFALWGKCGVIEPLHFEAGSAVLLQWPVKREQTCELDEVLLVLEEYYHPAFIVLLSSYETSDYFDGDVRRPDIGNINSILSPLLGGSQISDSITPVVRLAPVASSFLLAYIAKHGKTTKNLYSSLSYSSHVERAWDELSMLNMKGWEAWPYSEKARTKSALTLKAMHGDWESFVEDGNAKKVLSLFGNEDVEMSEQDLDAVLKWSLPVGQDPDRARLLLALWGVVHPMDSMPSLHSLPKRKSSRKPRKRKFGPAHDLEEEL